MTDSPAPRLRVAFVDDDPHVLRGIRRAMADMDEAWDMAFFESGAEALAAARVEPFDIVVSDMRMPGMDGAHLLAEIRALAPATIRVILSGYADSDAVLRTVGPAHIYLAKPCDAETLLGAIRRQAALRTVLDSPALRALLAGLSNLPSLPEVFVRLHSELYSPDAAAKAVAEIIAQDVAMTAELLKLTNSAYFRSGGGVATPLQAVRMLGIEVIQALVLKAGVFRQFAGRPDLVALLEALSAHGIAVADLAERIAVVEGADPVTARSARIAAMLADIGRVVLIDADPERYRAMLADRPAGQPLPVAEQAAFGAPGGLIGAYLLGLWGFADPIVEAVAHADLPSAGVLEPESVLLTVVHAARRLGPCSPFDRPGIDRGLDMAYLIAVRRDGHLARWRALAHDAEQEG